MHWFFVFRTLLFIMNEDIFLKGMTLNPWVIFLTSLFNALFVLPDTLNQLKKPQLKVITQRHGKSYGRLNRDY